MTTPFAYALAPVPPAQALGGAQAGAPATPGNGWAIKVYSHADFSTLLAELPAFQSLQFARLLNDKGAGTVVLNRDSKVLWPPGAYSLSGNTDFAGGSRTGWGQAGTSSAGVVTGEGGLYQYSQSMAPDGSSANNLVLSPAFPVYPGMTYTTSALYSLNGTGVTVPFTVAGFRWLDSTGTLLTSNGTSLSTLLPTITIPAPSPFKSVTATFTAPQGATLARAAFGLQGRSGAAPNTFILYLQHCVTTYDQGGVTLGDLLLDYENLWSVYLDGVRVFDFLGETVTDQAETDSEQRLATVTGPGAISTLTWGKAMPPGFPDIVLKTDSILDGFAEVDSGGNPAVDYALWNDSTAHDHITLSPLGTCQLTASPSGTILGATPYDITGSLISAQLNPIQQGGLDGSQVTQFYVEDLGTSGNYALIGLTATQFYAQISIKGHLQTKQFGKYDSNAHAYWQISEDGSGNFNFWTSADGTTWVLQWKIGHSGWTPNNVGVFFSAAYDTDNSQIVTITNLNSNVITPSSAGNIFLDTPIMGVWSQLFDACQARGTVPFLTTLVNGTTDSYGNPWTDGMSVQVQNGTDLYSLLQAYAGIVNADYIMDPGLLLQVGLPVGGVRGAVSLGNDLTKTVIIHPSAQITDRQRVRARDQIANMVAAVNADGTVVTDIDSASIANWQQREQWIQTAEQVNAQSMAVVVAASLDQTRDQVTSWTLSVDPFAEGASPLVDFDAGDWVSAERPFTAQTTYDSIRVIGIAMQVDAAGITKCDLTLQSYIQWQDQQLQYLVNKFGGQFINTLGTTPVTSVGGPGGLPIVTTPTLGGLGGVSIS